MLLDESRNELFFLLNLIPGKSVQDKLFKGCRDTLVCAGALECSIQILSKIRVALCNLVILLFQLFQDSSPLCDFLLGCEAAGIEALRFFEIVQSQIEIVFFNLYLVQDLIGDFCEPFELLPICRCLDSGRGSRLGTWCTRRGIGGGGFCRLSIRLCLFRKQRTSSKNRCRAEEKVRDQPDLKVERRGHHPNQLLVKATELGKRRHVRREVISFYCPDLQSCSEAISLAKNGTARRLSLPNVLSRMFNLH